MTPEVNGEIPSPPLPSLRVQPSEVVQCLLTSPSTLRVHPYGASGHRAMAEIAFHHLLVAAEGLLSGREPFGAAEAAIPEEPIPPPLLPGNFESQVDSCIFQSRFSDIVRESVVRDQGCSATIELQI